MIHYDDTWSSAEVSPTHSTELRHISCSDKMRTNIDTSIIFKYSPKAAWHKNTPVNYTWAGTQALLLWRVLQAAWWEVMGCVEAVNRVLDPSVQSNRWIVATQQCFLSHLHQALLIIIDWIDQPVNRELMNWCIEKIPKIFESLRCCYRVLKVLLYTTRSLIIYPNYKLNLQFPVFGC